MTKQDPPPPPDRRQPEQAGTGCAFVIIVGGAVAVALGLVFWLLSG